MPHSFAQPPGHKASPVHGMDTMQEHGGSLPRPTTRHAIDDFHWALHFPNIEILSSSGIATSSVFLSSMLKPDSRLDEGDGGSVESNETSSGGNVRNGSGSLLLAESLNGRHLVDFRQG